MLPPLDTEMCARPLLPARVDHVHSAFMSSCILYSKLFSLPSM